MVHMQGVVKKWGNAYGILIPKSVLKKAGLKEEQKVDIDIRPKNATARRLFGMFKDFPLTGQQVKDQAREELYDD